MALKERIERGLNYSPTKVVVARSESGISNVELILMGFLSLPGLAILVFDLALFEAARRTPWVERIVKGVSRLQAKLSGRDWDPELPGRNNMVRWARSR